MRIGYVGFELSWIDKIRAVNPDMKIVDLSRGIELILENEEDHQHNFMVILMVDLILIYGCLPLMQRLLQRIFTTNCFFSSLKRK